MKHLFIHYKSVKFITCRTSSYAIFSCNINRICGIACLVI